MNRFDLLLNRVVGLTQVGLFALAIGGLFYTVIPLYQNAQLSESLAKRELEIAQLEQRKDALSAQISERETDLLIRFAAAECSGLLVPSNFEEQARYLLEEKPPPADPLIDYMRSHTVTSCLEKEFSDPASLQDINTSNRAYLAAIPSRIGPRLDAERTQLLDRIDVGHETHGFSRFVGTASQAILSERLSVSKTLSEARDEQKTH